MQSKRFLIQILFEKGSETSSYALGRHSSLGGVIPVVHHTGMSYLYTVSFAGRTIDSPSSFNKNATISEKQ